ncbi:MAG: hypothetical protein FWC27_08515 [Firmicutes bacterium]|nr:hypothetical protein [Bacillota bacterium]
MFYENEYTRVLLEEERRLMREITTQRMSWSTIGKMIKLNALLHERRRAY